MPVLRSVSLIVLLLAVLPLCPCHPSIRTRESERPECRGCGNECHKCVYGVTTSLVCKVRECHKGPNERCGGHDNINGICGEGMRCQCERCTGCSVNTLECSEEPFGELCLPREDEASRGYWDLQRNNWFTLVK